MRFLTALLPFVFAGCMTIPGQVEIQESKAEGTRQMVMQPGTLSGEMKLALRKPLKTNDDKLTLEAIVMRAASIDSKDSLVINIDGNVTRLSSPDMLTRREVYPGSYPVRPWTESSKTYEVDLDLVKKMIAGKQVFVRINTGSDYSEAQFEGGLTTARDGFEDFVKKLEKYRNPSANSPAASNQSSLLPNG